jgi:hypothetical protein
MARLKDIPLLLAIELSEVEFSVQSLLSLALVTPATVSKQTIVKISATINGVIADILSLAVTQTVPSVDYKTPQPSLLFKLQ